jgi:uncharacterized protein YjiS (DUF1127 family)
MSTARIGTSQATLAGRLLAPSAQTSAALLAEALLTWLERARQRRQLGGLTEHMLKDIGLSRSDVESEIAKPFWRQ